MQLNHSINAKWSNTCTLLAKNPDHVSFHMLAFETSFYLCLLQLNVPSHVCPSKTPSNHLSNEPLSFHFRPPSPYPHCTKYHLRLHPLSTIPWSDWSVTQFLEGRPRGKNIPENANCQDEIGLWELWELTRDSKLSLVLKLNDICMLNLHQLSPLHLLLL